eukprot:12762078-Alexandrium_andersonii.AAC.1
MLQANRPVEKSSAPWPAGARAHLCDLSEPPLISLQAFEPRTARAQKWPRHWSPKLWRAAFCVFVSRRC